MKKPLAFIIIAAAICFSFCACAGGETDGAQSENNGTVADGRPTDDSDEGVPSGGGQTDAPSGDIEEVTCMYIYINGNRLEVELAENSSAAALAAALSKDDIVYMADDYGNFEKVGDIGMTLPRNDGHISVSPGDVILYLGSNICLYYGSNSWNFTRLGRINGYSDEQLRTLLGAGQGSVEVRLSLS